MIWAIAILALVALAAGFTWGIVRDLNLADAARMAAVRDAIDEHTRANQLATQLAAANDQLARARQALEQKDAELARDEASAASSTDPAEAERRLQDAVGAKP